MIKKALLGYFIVLGLIAFLISVGIADAITYYDFTTYDPALYSNGVVYAPPFPYDGTCEIKMSGYNTFLTASSASSVVGYYSPLSNLLATSTISGLGNTTCYPYGSTSWKTISKNSITNNYDSRMSFTTNAYSGYVMLENSYRCQVSGNSININLNNKNNAFLRVLTFYDAVANTTKNAWAAAIAGNYTKCGNLSIFALTDYNESHMTTDKGLAIFYYPFNSSGGSINYTFGPMAINTEIAGQNTYFYVDLVDVATKTVTNIIQIYNITTATGLSTTLAKSGTLALTENKQYILIFSIYEDYGTASSDNYYYAPEYINLSIATYHSNWVCGDWSICESGYKSRSCHDSGGVGSDYIDVSTCAGGIVESALLGFTDFESTGDVLICVPGWTGCTDYGFGGYGIQNITAQRPSDWTIIGDADGYLRNFVSMVLWGGTMSMKMWAIPMKLHEPNDAGTACENKTYDIYPTAEHTFGNTTLFAAKNVTFPASNMRITFDVIKCGEQVRQHGATFICPEYCYAENCSSIPDGYYFFTLYDPEEDKYFNKYGNAADMAQTVQIDLTNFGIVAGRNYTIGLGVINEFPYSTAGDCAIFKNVKYDVLIQSFLGTVPSGTCESQCDKGAWIEASYSSTGDCLLSKTEDSPNCCSGEECEHLITHTDFCKNSTTLKHFNPALGGYEYLQCQCGCDSTDNSCYSETECEAAAAAVAPTTPTTTEEWTSVLLTPMLWVSIIITIVCCVITVYAPGAWPLAAIGIAQLVVVLSFLAILPLIYGVIIVLISIVMIAYLIAKPGGG
jgi:hypothetical protein